MYTCRTLPRSAYAHFPCAWRWSRRWINLNWEYSRNLSRVTLSSTFFTSRSYWMNSPWWYLSSGRKKSPVCSSSCQNVSPTWSRSSGILFKQYRGKGGFLPVWRAFQLEIALEEAFHGNPLDNIKVGHCLFFSPGHKFSPRIQCHAYPGLHGAWSCHRGSN